MTPSPDTLEAGRELDAIVAHKVMGWGEGVIKMARDGMFDPYPSPYIPDEFCVAGPPEFSTDPAAMMQVVEKMHAAHHVVSIMWHTDNEIRCEIDDACAVADSAPLAVCRAALLAVAQEVK